MSRTKIILGIVGGVALLGGIGYYFYSRRRILGIENWNLVSKNVPSTKTYSDVKELMLSDGSYVNFFQNNRFFVYDKKGEDKNMLSYGFYYNGGKNLESDKGKKIKGNSVIQNINKSKETF